MKITPLEIRQKAFSTQFRGYDKDEVDAFLLSLSQEWERVNTGLKDIQMKYDNAEIDLRKLREVESSLFKTLKTAEDTSNSLIEQASRSSELQLKETQMNSEALINEARMKAKGMIDEAEVAIKNSFELMKDQIKGLENEFKTLEAQRDSLLIEMKDLTSNMENRIHRAEENKIKFNPELNFRKVGDIKVVTEPLNKAYHEVNHTTLDTTNQIEWSLEAKTKEEQNLSVEVKEEKKEILSKKKIKPENLDEGDSFFDEV